MADGTGAAAGAAAGTLISPGIGTVIGAGLGVIGDFISNKQSYDQSVELWKMQQEYNLPKNQIARLKEAGLNPNLVYGNGQVVGNTASQQAHSPQAMQLGKIDLAGRYAQLANLQAQNDLLQAQTRKTNEETTGQQLANDLTSEFGRLEHGAALNLTEQNIKSAQAIQNNTEAQTALIQTQQIGYAIANSKSELELQKFKDLYQVDINKAFQEYENLVKTGQNIDANTALAYQKAITEPVKRMLMGHQAQMFDAMTENFFSQSEYTQELTKGQKLSNLFNQRTFDKRVETVTQSLNQLKENIKKTAAETNDIAYKQRMQKVQMMLNVIDSAFRNMESVTRMGNNMSKTLQNVSYMPLKF